MSNDTFRDEVSAMAEVTRRPLPIPAEVERLRAEVAAERAAVVAWLRECALDPETTGAEMRLLQAQATAIERGVHRREGEK